METLAMHTYMRKVLRKINCDIILKSWSSGASMTFCGK